MIHDREKMPARQENLQALLDFINSHAEKICKQSDLNRIRLACEEALVNVFLYAYPPQTGGSVEVCLDEVDGPVLIVEIHDQGIPFDPLSIADPDTEKGLMERKIGGMGIFLIRKTADGVRYERKDNTNILTLIFLPLTIG